MLGNSYDKDLSRESHRSVLTTDGYRVVGQDRKSNAFYLTNSDGEYLMREITLTDRAHVQFMRETLAKREKLRHQHYAGLLEYEVKEESKGVRIRTLYEFPFRTLDQERRERAQANMHFTEYQLESILTSLTLVLAYLQKQNILVQSVRSSNIFISQSGLIKIVQPLARQVRSNYQLCIGSTPTPNSYLSPSQLASLSMLEPLPVHDHFKSQVFSIGILLMELALLHTQEALYVEGGFDQGQFEEDLEAIARRYGIGLVDRIRGMTVFEEGRRPDWVGMERLNARIARRNAAERLEENNLPLWDQEIDKSAIDSFMRVSGITQVAQQRQLLKQLPGRVQNIFSEAIRTQPQLSKSPARPPRQLPVRISHVKPVTDKHPNIPVPVQSPPPPQAFQHLAFPPHVQHVQLAPPHHVAYINQNNLSTLQSLQNVQSPLQLYPPPLPPQSRISYNAPPNFNHRSKLEIYQPINEPPQRLSTEPRSKSINQGDRFTVDRRITQGDRIIERGMPVMPKAVIKEKQILNVVNITNKQQIQSPINQLPGRPLLQHLHINTQTNHASIHMNTTPTLEIPIQNQIPAVINPIPSVVMTQSQTHPEPNIPFTPIHVPDPSKTSIQQQILPILPKPQLKILSKPIIKEQPKITAQISFQIMPTIQLTINNQSPKHQIPSQRLSIQQPSSLAFSESQLNPQSICMYSQMMIESKMEKRIVNECKVEEPQFHTEICVPCEVSEEEIISLQQIMSDFDNEPQIEYREQRIESSVFVNLWFPKRKKGIKQNQSSPNLMQQKLNISPIIKAIPDSAQITPVISPEPTLKSKSPQFKPEPNKQQTPQFQQLKVKITLCNPVNSRPNQPQKIIENPVVNKKISNDIVVIPEKQAPNSNKCLPLIETDSGLTPQQLSKFMSIHKQGRVQFLKDSHQKPNNQLQKIIKSQKPVELKQNKSSKIQITLLNPQTKSTPVKQPQPIQVKPNSPRVPIFPPKTMEPPKPQTPLLNGTAYHKFDDGMIYQGDWKDGHMNGFGRLFYCEGKIAYEGNWQNGEFHGKGLLLNRQPKPKSNPSQTNYSNFSTIGENWTGYDGEFQKNKKHGHGTLLLNNGQVFDGEFYNDMVNGPGVFVCQNKAINGVWKDNRLVKLLDTI